MEDFKRKSEDCGLRPRVFPGIPAIFWPIWLIWGPNQLISTEFPRETIARKREGAVEKHRRDRGVSEETCVRPKKLAATVGVATWEGAARWSLRFSKISLRERWNRNLPASTEICCRLLLLSRSVLTCPDGSAQNHSSGPPRRLHSARLFARKCLPSVHSTDHSVAGVEGHR